MNFIDNDDNIKYDHNNHDDFFIMQLKRINMFTMIFYYSIETNKCICRSYNLCYQH